MTARCLTALLSVRRELHQSSSLRVPLLNLTWMKSSTREPSICIFGITTWTFWFSFPVGTESVSPFKAFLECNAWASSRFLILPTSLVLSSGTSPEHGQQRCPFCSHFLSICLCLSIVLFLHLVHHDNYYCSRSHSFYGVLLYIWGFIPR